MKIVWKKNDNIISPKKIAKKKEMITFFLCLTDYISLWGQLKPLQLALNTVDNLTDN